MFRLEQIPIERSNYVQLENKFIWAFKVAVIYLIVANVILLIIALSFAQKWVYRVAWIEFLWIIINGIILANK